MFDRNSLIRLMYSLFVAALMTIVVLAITSEYLEAVFIIIKGMFAGAVIWFVGEVLFTLCEKLFPKSILPGYVVLVFLILVGTAGFGYVFGVENGALLIKMVIVAELCGIGITLFYRKKYTKNLNKNLNKNKNQL